MLSAADTVSMWTFKVHLENRKCNTHNFTCSDTCLVHQSFSRCLYHWHFWVPANGQPLWNQIQGFRSPDPCSPVVGLGNEKKKKCGWKFWTGAPNIWEQPLCYKAIHLLISGIWIATSYYGALSLSDFQSKLNDQFVALYCCDTTIFLSSLLFPCCLVIWCMWSEQSQPPLPWNLIICDQVPASSRIINLGAIMGFY